MPTRATLRPDPPVGTGDAGMLAALAAGEPIFVPCEGSSMVPVIWNGDTVRVEPLTREPQVGDVVLAVVGGRWTLHRLVSIAPGRIVTRGDNRLGPDPPISRAAVLGLAIGVVAPRTVPLVWPRDVAAAWVASAPWMARTLRVFARRRDRGRGGSPG